MSIKYKVLAVAYRNIDQKILDEMMQFSVKNINTVTDLNDVNIFRGKGFNLNDRISIYNDWFKDVAKVKLNEGYKVAILELPFNASIDKVDAIEFLDKAYGDDLLILGKVDV